MCGCGTRDTRWHKSWRTWACWRARAGVRVLAFACWRSRAGVRVLACACLMHLDELRLIAETIGLPGIVTILVPNIGRRVDRQKFCPVLLLHILKQP
jgi:hypothetical protein